jgi:hypothetical protein
MDTGAATDANGAFALTYHATDAGNDYTSLRFFRTGSTVKTNPEISVTLACADGTAGCGGRCCGGGQSCQAGACVCVGGRTCGNQCLSAGQCCTSADCGDAGHSCNSSHACQCDSAGGYQACGTSCCGPGQWCSGGTCRSECTVLAATRVLQGGTWSGTTATCTSYPCLVRYETNCPLTPISAEYSLNGGGLQSTSTGQSTDANGYWTASYTGAFAGRYTSLRIFRNGSAIKTNPPATVTLASPCAGGTVCGGQCCAAGQWCNGGTCRSECTVLAATRVLQGGTWSGTTATCTSYPCLVRFETNCPLTPISAEYSLNGGALQSTSTGQSTDVNGYWTANYSSVFRGNYTSLRIFRNGSTTKTNPAATITLR